MALVKKLNYNSPIIISFFIISFIVLLSNMSSFFTLRFTSFKDMNMYLRLFTYPLAHANFNHFINNFLLILVVGPNVEEKYGSRRLFFMIIITSAITGFVNILLFANIGLLGASGIAFMLIILSSYTNAKKGTIPITFIIVLCLYIGREVYNGIVVNDSVSQLAHILGGAFGALYCFIIPTKSFSNKKKMKFENTEPMNKI